MTSKAKNSVVYILLAIIGIILYSIAHASTTEYRRYKTIGREAFILLLPVLYYIIRACAIDIIKDIRKEKRNENCSSTVSEQK